MTAVRLLSSLKYRFRDAGIRCSVAVARRLVRHLAITVVVRFPCDSLGRGPAPRPPPAGPFIC